MAGKPIAVEFIANATRFLRGTKDVETSLDGVGTALEDVASDADRLEAEMSAAFSRVDTNTGSSFTRVKDHGTHAMKEIKDEGRQSAGELFSSFDGSAEGIIGAFQEVAGTVASKMGPIGLAAGAAAAIGIGMLWKSWQETADRIKADMDRLIGKMAETGRALNTKEFDEQIRQFAQENTEAFNAMVDAAQAAGIDANDALHAYLGDPTAIEKIGPLLDDIISKGTDISNSRSATPLYSEAAQNAQALKTALGQGANKAEQSAEFIENLNAALGKTGDIEADRAGKTKEAVDSAGKLEGHAKTTNAQIAEQNAQLALQNGWLTTNAALWALIVAHSKDVRPVPSGGHRP